MAAGTGSAAQHYPWLQNLMQKKPEQILSEWNHQFHLLEEGCEAAAVKKGAIATAKLADTVYTGKLWTVDDPISKKKFYVGRGPQASEITEFYTAFTKLSISVVINFSRLHEGPLGRSGAMDFNDILYFPCTPGEIAHFKVPVGGTTAEVDVNNKAMNMISDVVAISDLEVEVRVDIDNPIHGICHTIEPIQVCAMQHIQHFNWPPDELPWCTDSILRTVSMLEQFHAAGVNQNDTLNVLLLCGDGFTRSGAFLALQYCVARVYSDAQSKSFDLNSLIKEAVLLTRSKEHRCMRSERLFVWLNYAVVEQCVKTLVERTTDKKESKRASEWLFKLRKAVYSTGERLPDDRGMLVIDSGGYDWSMSFCTCEEQFFHQEPPIVPMPSGHWEGLYSISKRGRVRDSLAKFLFHMVCPPCPGEIISKLALFHMDLPSYEFIQFGLRNENDYRLGLSIPAQMSAQLSSSGYLSYLGQLRCFFIDDGRGGRLACIFASAYTPILPMVDMTILFFHTNNTDLGLAAGYVVRLSRRFGARVLAVEYPGFGLSSGQCSEDKFYESAEIAYDYLTRNMGISADKIIIVGTSLGSAAAIHVASRRQVKAVVLQGAFLSALRMRCPFKRCVSKCDRFLNIEKIGSVLAPTLIVHGKQDQMFSLRHARLLRDCCPGAANIEPFYVDRADHLGFADNVPYWQRLHKFLHYEVASLEENIGCCGQKVEEMAVYAKWNDWKEKRGVYSSAVASRAHPPTRRENPRFPIILCEPCVAMATKKTTGSTTETSPGTSEAQANSPSPGSSSTPTKSPSSEPRSTPKKSPSPGFRHSDDIFIGTVVEVTIVVNITTPDLKRYGVVRWIGHLPDIEETMAGVELDAHLPYGFRRGTDGYYRNVRYFSCNPKRGVFVPLSSLHRESRSGLVQYVRSINPLEETMPDLPYPWKMDSIHTLVGKPKGIQGKNNSCYMDATLFALFTASDAFDDLLSRPRTRADIELYDDIRTSLKFSIVTPLRWRGYVESESIMKLRRLLSHALPGMIRLTTKEKDPRELINALFGPILGVPPIIHLTSGQSLYIYPLVIDDASLKVPLTSVQTLLERSFFCSNVQLRSVPNRFIVQIPRYGKQKLSDYIVPTLRLDLSNILTNRGRLCSMCGNRAQWQCKKCYLVATDDYSKTFFCVTCFDRFHSPLPRNNGHQVTALPRASTPLVSEERPYLELSSVICIESSHYVSYVRVRDGDNVKWVFFDSMADGKGGHNLPQVVGCDDYFDEVLKPENRHLLVGALPLPVNRSERRRRFLSNPLPPFLERLLQDCYICVYVRGSQ